MRRALVTLSLALIAAFFRQPAWPQCAPSLEVEAAVNAYAAAGVGRAPEADRRAAQKEVLDQALAEHPGDPFLLDRLRDWFDDNTAAGREAAVSFFAALHDQHPDQPAVTAAYADVLRNKDSAQALKLLEASEKAHPENAQAHYKLLPFFEGGPFRNPQRLSAEINAYLKLCPAPDSAYVYRVMMAGGDQEQIARHARLLRARLEADTLRANPDLWATLWSLEFKAAAPERHAEERERIRKDLARVEAMPDSGKVTRLALLRQGYELVNNTAAMNRVDARIVEKYPDSIDAEQVVTKRWRNEHPFPGEGDHAAKQAWFRLSAAAEHEWYERWHGPMQIWQEFDAKAALDDTTPEELLTLAQEYVAAYHATPNAFYGGNPMEFDVADALIKKKALPSEIPAWLDEGFRRENARPSRLLGMSRDEMDDAMKANADAQIASMRIERARILLDYYDAAGEPGKAAGVEDQLSGVNPADARLKPELNEVLAHAAVMQNRKLDALMYYRAARDLGGRQSHGGVTDDAELDQKIDRLYKELGGTHATMALFGAKSPVSPVSSVSWETPKNPLPSFSLTDLGGKTWALVNLKGVATLINVWASWCGPCREEHPELQKLYDKVKDRKDVAVLSVNVDDEAGLVAPYMTEHKYTFPVVLGRELVNAVMGTNELDIPQNWLVSAGGKLEAVGIGYNGEPDWQSVVLSKLQAMAGK